MKDYAKASRAVKGSTAAPDDYANDLCCVAGCHLPGTMSHSTTGSSEWYCRLHFGVEIHGRASVTAKTNNRMGLIRLALRCANAPVGARIPRQIEALMAQLGRDDLLQGARDIQPDVPLTGRALGRFISAALDRECRPDHTDHGAPVKSDGNDDWFRVADILPMEAA